MFAGGWVIPVLVWTSACELGGGCGRPKRLAGFGNLLMGARSKRGNETGKLHALPNNRIVQSERKHQSGGWYTGQRDCEKVTHPQRRQKVT